MQYDYILVSFILVLINPPDACAARVTVVLSCVCVSPSVCLSTQAILAVCAIKSIMKDTTLLSIKFAAILKWHFSLKFSYLKVWAFLLTSAGAAIFS